MSQLQVTGEAKIRDIQGPVVANSGVITALDGAASQYVRGDGTLADFPTSTGGGSSVSYYLNSSVSQGTIGGVAYRQLGKTPIAGAGTDITISANGYIASYITDANDPALLEVPAGNFNCEFYFAVNSNNHDPYVYAEVYKYDGTTFTLIGSSQSVPEYLTNGTTLSPYYFAIPVTQTTLAITDRIAIRIYVNVDGRVVTLHTENNHLCQVVTTFSKGLTSLNNLTRQVQFLATGTSGTDFNISSSTATHTFNLPIASATNTGKLSSTDWSTFNAKQPAGNYVTLDTTQTITGDKTFTGIVKNDNGILLKNSFITYSNGYTSLSADTGNLVISSLIGGTPYDNEFSFTPSTSNTYTFPNASGTVALTSNINYPVTSVFGRTGAVVAVSGDYNTSQVTENTNLYFTDARARAALSFTAGSGAYNSTTGVITIPTNTNQLTNGASFITLTSLSGGVGISYNNTTGVITNSAPDQTVSLTAGAGISISGTYPSFTIASTITQYTDALARAAISLTTTGTSGAATYNSTTGVFNIPNYAPDLSGYVPTSRTITINGTSFDLSANRSYSVGTVTSVGLSSATSGVTIGSTPITTSGTITLAIATASGSQNGLLSSTDWTTFNNKQNALTNPVTGTGTTNYLPKFTGASTIGNSSLNDDGTSVAVGIALTANTGNLQVGGTANTSLFAQQGTDTVRMGVRASGRTGIVFDSSNATFTNRMWYIDNVGANGSLTIGRSGLDVLTFSNGGNLGLGVTPSAWSAYKAFEIGYVGNGLFATGQNDINILSNAYFNAGYKYGGTGKANLFEIYNGEYYFMTAPSGTAGNAITFTQAMTLFSTGNLAVGTTTDASRKLDVNGVIRTQNAGSAGAPSIELGTSAQGNGLFYPTTNTIAIATNDTERMRITSAGLVGIGTVNSFLAQLNVGRISAGATTRALSLYNNSSNVADTGVAIEFYPNTGNDDRCAKISSVNTTTVNNADLRFFTSNDAAPAERMRITSGGNVGIGTNSPQAPLQVNGNFRLYTTNGDGNELRGIFSVGGAADPLSFSMYKGNATTIGTFLTADGTSYFNGGNVLVATTTDNGQGKLQVNGAITANNISYTGELVTTSTTFNATYYHIISGAVGSGQTYTLPSPSSNNLQYVVINKSNFSQTISAGSGFTIYNMAGSDVGSITLASKARCFIIADGSGFYQIF
jgi:hypothetical protein